MSDIAPVNVPKKRGRKKQKDEDYINGANQKIELLRNEYKKA